MGDKKKADTSLNPKQRSRREFLESAGTTAALASAVPVLGISTAQAQSDIESTAAKTRIQLTVNGSRHSVDVEDRWTLVEVLRDQLDLTGTKIGCDRSECGACTVIMNGKPVYSCSQLAVWADGAQVTTVEGLASGGQLSPVQQAFVENNGPQCGFCTPGQLMTATALLSNNATPNADEVKQALVGNLCRCSNYNAIVEAVVMAGERSGSAV
ncbi:MAG: (2Fe-2S)-binding protein [Gammaproteobacteria bacterium]|jgi:aerobic-type carbon monoxide dehydrogenase small subunit (CoxS/CutS family)|tara:strand:- start:114 stop:749 length:636 start_codon:yes stop_codon:yes gene_type:complete